MPKYRKKPVVIEAMHWDGYDDSLKEINEWMWSSLKPQRLFMDADGGAIHVRTLEGNMLVSPGDYIIQGVQGEFYPCKPDIFDATYEKVED